MNTTTSAVRRVSGARTWSLCVLVCGAALLAANSCRRTPPAPSAPIRLVIGFSDPGTTQANGFQQLISLLEDERLLRTTRGGQFDPSLLERWQQAPDGLSWELTLRHGVKFHNGQPLDAKIVAEQLNATAAAPNARPGTRDILKAEAKDPQTIVVRMRRPSRFLLDALTLETVQSHDTPPAKAGPFQLVDKPTDVAIFRAFPEYFRGKPAIDEIELRPFKTPRTAWSAMMRNEVDFVYQVSPEARGFVEESSGAQIKTFLRPFVFTLGLNLHHPLLNLRPVRVALNEAINREDLIKTVFNGHATPATSPIWPQHWAHDDSVPAFHFDPASAIRRLDQAGLTLKKGSGAMPNRLRFTCLVSQSDPRYERIALVLQRQLVEAGIDMQLEPVSLVEITRRVAAGKYEAFLLDMATSTLDWTYMFWHSPESGTPPFIDSGYQAADVVLDRVRLSKTDDELKTALRDLQRVMYDDPPAVFLFWSEMTRAVSARFVIPTMPDGEDVRTTIWQWRLAPNLPRPASQSTASAP